MLAFLISFFFSFFCCSGCRSLSGWTESLLRQLDQSFLSLGTDKTCMAQIHLANRLRDMGFFFQISQTAQHWSSMLAGNSGQTRCQAGCCIRSCKVPKALIFATDIWTTNFLHFSELTVPRIYCPTGTMSQAKSWDQLLLASLNMVAGTS